VDLSVFASLGSSNVCLACENE